MAKLLISVTKPKWNRESWPPFVGEGQIPSDCLKELRVETNRLSVWFLEDVDNEKKRILTALAATRKSIQEYDFLLFDAELLASIPVAMEVSNGKTPDAGANPLHRDLIELTGAKLLAVATTAGLNGVTHRVSAKQISQWLREGMAENRLDVTLMPPDLRSKLQVAHGI